MALDLTLHLLLHWLASASLCLQHDCCIHSWVWCTRNWHPLFHPRRARSACGLDSSTSILPWNIQASQCRKHRRTHAAVCSASVCSGGMPRRLFKTLSFLLSMLSISHYAHASGYYACRAHCASSFWRKVCLSCSRDETRDTFPQSMSLQWEVYLIQVGGVCQTSWCCMAMRVNIPRDPYRREACFWQSIQKSRTCLYCILKDCERGLLKLYWFWKESPRLWVHLVSGDLYEGLQCPASLSHVFCCFVTGHVHEYYLFSTTVCLATWCSTMRTVTRVLDWPRSWQTALIHQDLSNMWTLASQPRSKRTMHCQHQPLGNRSPQWQSRTHNQTPSSWREWHDTAARDVCTNLSRLDSDFQVRFRYSMLDCLVRGLQENKMLLYLFWWARECCKCKHVSSGKLLLLLGFTWERGWLGGVGPNREQTHDAQRILRHVMMSGTCLTCSSHLLTENTTSHRQAEATRCVCGDTRRNINSTWWLLKHKLPCWLILKSGRMVACRHKAIGQGKEDYLWECYKRCRVSNGGRIHEL